MKLSLRRLHGFFSGIRSSDWRYAFHLANPAGIWGLIIRPICCGVIWAHPTYWGLVLASKFSFCCHGLCMKNEPNSEAHQDEVFILLQGNEAKICNALIIQVSRNDWNHITMS